MRHVLLTTLTTLLFIALFAVPNEKPQQNADVKLGQIMDTAATYSETREEYAKNCERYYMVTVTGASVEKVYGRSEMFFFYAGDKLNAGQRAGQIRVAVASRGLDWSECDYSCEVLPDYKALVAALDTAE